MSCVHIKRGKGSCSPQCPTCSIFQAGLIELPVVFVDGANSDHSPSGNTNGMNVSLSESNEMVNGNEKRMCRPQDIALTYQQKNDEGHTSEHNGLSSSLTTPYSIDPLPTLVEHHEEELFEHIQELMESSSHSSSLDHPSSFLPEQKSDSGIPKHPKTVPTGILRHVESIERDFQVPVEVTFSLSDSASEEDTGQVSDKELVGAKTAMVATHAIKSNSFGVEESMNPQPLSYDSELPMQVKIQKIEVESPKKSSTASSPPLLHLDSDSAIGSHEVSLDEEGIKLPEAECQTVTPLDTDHKIPPSKLDSFLPSKPKGKAPRKRTPPPPPPRKPKPNSVSPTKASMPVNEKTIFPATSDNGLSPLPSTMSLNPVSPIKASMPVNEKTIFPATSDNGVSPLPSTQSLNPVSPTKASTPVNNKTIFSATNDNGVSPLPSTQSLNPVSLTKASMPVNEKTFSPATNRNGVSPLPSMQSLEHDENTSSAQQASSSLECTSTPQERIHTGPTHAPATEQDTSCKKQATSPQKDVPDEHFPRYKDVYNSKHTTTSQEVATSRKHAYSNSRPNPTSPHASTNPPQDLFITRSPARSDSPDLVTQMQELAYSLTYSTEDPSKPVAGTSQKKLNTSKKQNGPPAVRARQTSLNEVTAPAQEQKQSSNSVDSSPIKPKPKSNTADNIEVMGAIKIQRVQKIRWTPSIDSTDSSPCQTPDLTEPVVDPQNQSRYRSTTLPSSYLHGRLKKQVSMPTNEVARQVKRNGHGGERRKGSVRDPAIVSRGIGGISGGIMTPKDQKKLMKHHTPPRSDNPYRQSFLQQQPQPWRQRSQLDLVHHSVKAGSKQMGAGIHNGIKTMGRQPNKSLTNAPVNKRSMTWSSSADGMQVAYTMSAKNPSVLCSYCHRPLGKTTVHSLPYSMMEFHTKCFICHVCKSPLGKAVPSTTVLMKKKQLYCCFCGASDSGKYFLTFSHKL